MTLLFKLKVYKMKIQILLCLLVSVCAMSRLGLFKRHHANTLEKEIPMNVEKQNRLLQNRAMLKSRIRQSARSLRLRRICTSQACRKCSDVLTSEPTSTSRKRRRTCVHLLRYCCREMRLIPIGYIQIGF